MTQSQHKELKIGFINGWFDGLHNGHVKLFKQAKDHCDYLIVAINHDTSWTKERTKLFTHDERKELLEAIKYIDEVVIFEETTPERILNDRKIHIVFKGLDYLDKELPEKHILLQKSIELMILKTTDHRSSQLFDMRHKVV